MIDRPSDRPSDQEVAEAVGATFQEKDVLAKQLGVKLEEIRPGYARATMKVRDDMSNAAGIGHGGATFILADSTFAFVCNVHNRKALATTCTITFTGAVRLGETLTAEAREVFLEGRNGVYDVTVTNRQGDTVALFRGHSRQVKGVMVPGMPPDVSTSS